MTMAARAKWLGVGAGRRRRGAIGGESRNEQAKP